MRLAQPVVLLLATLVLVGTVRSQPYAADGGFGRPVAVAGPGIVSTLAVAEDGGDMQVVWADSSALWRRELFDLDAEPVRVVEGRSFRTVTATSAGGDIAVAWLERDLRTGRTHHSLTWRSQTYLLFEANLEVPLVIGATDGSPWVLASPRADGQAHITLYRVAADGSLAEPLVLHSTPLGIAGLMATGVDDWLGGPALVAWLEGRTTEAALGPVSSWSAFVLDTSGPSRPLELGAADVQDQRQSVAIGQTPTGSAYALWLTETGALELTGIERSAGGLAVVSRSTIGERGRPIEVLPDGAFWVSDAFVRRATIDATGAVSDVTSVAWSPAPIEGATLMATHDVTPSPVTAPPTVTLAWYGRLQGGAIMGFASDDSVAFSPDLKDRVAALMGWNPWTIWQEALGQALASLLAGVAVTMGLTPVLFLLTLLALRIPALDARPAATGVLIGVILPVLVVLVINLRYPSPELTAALSPSSLVTGAPFFVIGGVLGFLITRRGDRERQATALLAACAAVFFSLAGLAFVTYRSWAAFVGLV